MKSGALLAALCFCTSLAWPAESPTIANCGHELATPAQLAQAIEFLAAR